MSDVLLWIPGMFSDTRPLWPMQVSAVINLHRSKLPPIPNEGRKRSVGGKKERKRGKKNCVIRSCITCEKWDVLLLAVSRISVNISEFSLLIKLLRLCVSSLSIYFMRFNYCVLFYYCGLTHKNETQTQFTRLKRNHMLAHSAASITVQKESKKWILNSKTAQANNNK